MTSSSTMAAGQTAGAGRQRGRRHPDSPRYRWVALSNTTLGVLMATLNSSILLISLPAIFRGIAIDPLQPANIGYLLWMIMGYLLVTAVLVVTLGRLGDMFGRVKIYNAGFAVFSMASVGLALDPFAGGRGAMWLIVLRVVQGVGGAMLMANSTAIITDVFPATRRGLAVGINMVAGIGGSFAGLVVGGVLSEVDWRLVFWVSVPFGVLGTVWAYLSLQDVGTRQRQAKVDWPGNLTFAVGLVALLAAITYGIQPYGGHAEGWTNPWVLAGLIGGALVLSVFCVVETRVAQPMFRLELFRIRAFTSGNIATLMSALSRGGLQFMLIIWLQGIWLPLHGYDYAKTPLWSAIYLIPLTVGFLAAAPLAGYLSDRFGARTFATGGLVIVAATFGLLLALPTDFVYWQFALILFVNGLGSGLFVSPNMTGVMNSLPPGARGAGSGMMMTLQNSGMALSIGVFFSTLIAGLAHDMPAALFSGLTGQGVPARVAHQVAGLPPVGTLFAAFLGFNPIQEILGRQVLGSLNPANAAILVGRRFFPNLVTGPFHHGLLVVFAMAIGICLVGAVASLFRGGRYVHGETPGPVEPESGAEILGRVSRVGDGAEILGRVSRVGDGAAVPAVVTLVDMSGGHAGRARAAASGTYRLRPAVPGTYLLVCTAPGFAPTVSRLLVDGVVLRHDIALAASPAPASTTARRRATPGDDKD